MPMGPRLMTLTYGALVSHCARHDSWWNTIKNGLALAGDQMGVSVRIPQPTTGDLAEHWPHQSSQAAGIIPNGIQITTPVRTLMCSKAQSWTRLPAASTVIS